MADNDNATGATNTTPSNDRIPYQPFPPVSGVVYITIVTFRAYDNDHSVTFVDDTPPMAHVRRRRIRRICNTFVELSFETYESRIVNSGKFKLQAEPHPDITARNAEVRAKSAALMRQMGDSSQVVE